MSPFPFTLFDLAERWPSLLDIQDVPYQSGFRIVAVPTALPDIWKIAGSHLDKHIPNY